VRTRLRDGADACVFDAPASPGGGLVASPDGAWVLRIGLDRTDVWRARDGALVRSPKFAARGWGGTAAFTPDGATLVVPTNKAAFVLYARFDWALPGLGRVSAMALQRDGSRLFAGSSAGALRAWDLTGIV